MSDTRTRIESRTEVSAYLQALKYALEQNAELRFQVFRKVDEERPLRYTNRFTVADLFPDENPTDALKRELKTLTIDEYIQTVQDLRYLGKSEMREFGRQYVGKGDVYIKIRVELLSAFGGHSIFIMSFHYAETPLTREMFPYRKQ